MKLTTLTIIGLLFLSSCTKNYDIPPSDGRIAKGNGSAVYIPLADNNTWSYEPVWMTTIISHTGNVYTISDNGAESTIWKDSTGEYMMQDLNNPGSSLGITQGFSGGLPFVYIPANPTAGQTWTDTVGVGTVLTARVISTNASIATYIYGYTSCLEISYTYTYSVAPNSGSVTFVKYFSKGVGPVYTVATINDYKPKSYSMNSFAVN